MASYRYLPITGQQIRLIRLLPERDERQPLRGELVTVELRALPPPLPANSPEFSKPVDEEKYTCYEAISYVWGLVGFEDELLTPEGVIAITPSLGSILRRLRNADTPRLLWADAVCINQKDDAEKEVQVALMGTIYSSAVRVFCDLGEASEEGHAVLDAMALYWRRNIRRGWVMADHNTAILEAEHLASIMGLTLPTEEEAAAIEDMAQGAMGDEFMAFTSLPWFRRVWTIQEFVLGRDIIMLYGTRQIGWGALWAGMVPYQGVMWPWQKLDMSLGESINNNQRLSYLTMCMLHAARVIDPETPHGKAFMAIVQHLAKTTALSQANNLPMCLLAFSFSGVTLPRDRYFGVLGLLDGVTEEPALRPDYTSPMEEITRRFWRWGLQQVSGADLLASAGTAGWTCTYPTWIRDITAGSWMEHVWVPGPASEASHCAGGRDGWTASFDEDDPDRMCLRAYHLDDVSEVMPGVGSDFDWEEMVSRVEDTLRFFLGGMKPISTSRDLRYPHTGEHVHEAALKTICNFSESDELPKFKEEFAKCLRLGLLIPLVDLKNWDDAEEHVKKVVRGFVLKDEELLQQLFLKVYKTWRLRMIKTKKGFFGCMPQETREGDSVWIVPGSRMPFVLRRSETHPGSYQVVGAGYVHGVMKGEALAMPGFSWRIVSLR